jgi:hypothetical protein
LIIKDLMEGSRYGKTVRAFEVMPDMINRLFSEGRVPVPPELVASHESTAQDDVLWPNQGVVLKAGDQQSALTKLTSCGKFLKPIKKAKDLNFSGVMPKNKEQNIMFSLLNDPDIRVVVITGAAGTGKAQPLDSKIMTPSGWKKMGDMKVGSEVCTPTGGRAKVTQVHPQGVKDIYKVTFTDGSHTLCCDDHLWQTQTKVDRDAKRKGTVKPLSKIKKTLRTLNGSRNHYIPILENLDLKVENLPFDPYTLGALLGDGTFNEDSQGFSNQDEYLHNKVKSGLKKIGCDLVRTSPYGYSIKGLTTLFQDLGLTEEPKFIPEKYLLQSRDNRLALLQGLMDTAGTIGQDGKNTTFSSTSKKVAEGVKFLVQSLGGTASESERFTKDTNLSGITEGDSYRLTLNLPNEVVPFQLPRQVQRWEPSTQNFPRRAVDTIEYYGKEEAQCITLDSQDHLYLTDDLIVTHNSLGIGAYGISQVLEAQEDQGYGKMILAKPLEIVTQTRFWGTVPGDENEKFGPFLKSFALMFENIVGKEGSRYIQQAITKKTIEFLPLELMRGATLRDAIVWYDEAQNLDKHECATLGTRIDDVGHSKLIMSGDLNQMDRQLTRGHTGLDTLCTSRHFLSSPLTCHVDLKVIERGKIAELFHKVFEAKEPT